MQRKESMQKNETTKFASLVATRKPRRMRDGALVHASGNASNGTWKPLARQQIWNHLQQRSREAMA
ncbi:MAG: hypothetical protein QF440_03135 [Candidatus Thalassarchaeaceae archaeon]|nr:hypothetical protein [Candidatus Thalassarchaeaceae archaeon]